MDNNNLRPNRLQAFCSITLKARSLSKPNPELFSALFNKTIVDYSYRQDLRSNYLKMRSTDELLFVQGLIAPK